MQNIILNKEHEKTYSDKVKTNTTVKLFLKSNSLKK